MVLPMRPRPALTHAYHLWHGHFRLFCRWCGGFMGGCGHQATIARNVPSPSLCDACEQERKVAAMLRGVNHDDGHY